MIPISVLILIQIFEKGDRSTFLHESGHFWLEQLKSDATQFGQEFTKDWGTVTKWWGQNTDTIRAEALDRARKKKDTAAVEAISKMSDAAVKKFVSSGNLRGEGAEFYLSVAMHEQFARGTENYFSTGHAPSIALADAFVAFAVWLRSVYRSIQRLTGRDGFDVQFSSEVTAVMDRMIATDTEITIAASQYQLASLFDTAEQAGMSKADFAAHQIGEARQAHRLGHKFGRARRSGQIDEHGLEIVARHCARQHHRGCRAFIAFRRDTDGNRRQVGD